VGALACHPASRGALSSQLGCYWAIAAGASNGQTRLVTTVRETTDTLCPACGNAVVTTTVTGRVRDRRITIHVHPEPNVAERCRYDAGPELGAVSLDKFPGDT
jgi:hypothetical protein